MNKFKWIAILIVVISCEQNEVIVQEKLLGNWIISEIYFNDNILNQKETKIIIGNDQFTVDKHGKFLLRFNDNSRVYGDIIMDKNTKEEDIVVIQNSTDDKFNGTYSYKIEVIESKKSKKVYLKMESKHIIFYANKQDFKVKL